MRVVHASALVILAICSPLVAATDSATFTNVSGASISNHPMQFGRQFAKGEITNYPQVLVGGTPVTTQANVQTRWSDGSVKHAIITFILAGPIANNGTSTFTFQNQTGCNCGASVHETRAGMLNTSTYDFDASVSSGTATISARTIVTDWDGSTTGPTGIQYWADGSIATTVLVADHSTSRAYDFGNDAHKSLRPIFHCTFWPSLGKVKVRFIVENSNTVALQDQTWNVKLKTGNASPTTVYTKVSIPQVAGTRWTKTFWIGGAPTDLYNLDHNVAYLKTTYAVPNYDTGKTVSAGQIASDYTAWLGRSTDIYGAGSWQRAMGTAGGRPDIGPHPNWCTRWLYTGDYRERQISLGNADLAGAWQIHQREGASGKFMDKAQVVPALGRIISISARPTLDYSSGYSEPRTGAGDKVTPVGGATEPTEGGWQWDMSHLPAAYVVPYLLTGDYFYLEQQWFWCAFSAAFTNQDNVDYGRGPTPSVAGIYRGQERAIAWGMRERFEAASLSPDGTAEKTLINAWIDDALAELDGVENLTDSFYYGNSNWAFGRTVISTNALFSAISPPLGQFFKGSSGFSQGGYGINTLAVYEAHSAFEMGYLCYALGRGAELGYHSDKLVQHRCAVWYNNLINDPDSNPYLIASGRTPTTAVVGHTFFSTMASLRTGYWPTELLAKVAGAVNGTCYIWQGMSCLNLTDYDNGYPFLGSAAISYITAYAGGTAAWTWASANIESASTYGDNPKWALRPRTDVSTTLSPCDLNGDGVVNTLDLQRSINQTLAIIPCTNADLDHNGLCNVVDVQRIVNAVLGKGCL